MKPLALARFLPVFVGTFGLLSLTLLHGKAPPKHGMVVAVSPPGADAGRDVLLAGGNAVDAAVATALVMAVTYPSAGNLGGGGFMVIHPAPGKGEPVVIEYREVAPSAASRKMYDKRHVVQPSGRRRPRHRRRPGAVHKKYGKLPWKDVVRPAVKLAEEGFVIDERLSSSLNWITSSKQVTPELCRVLGKNNGKDNWHAGDKLVQKDLAKTLKRIAEKGADGFYKGETAELFVKEMKAGNGLITAEDLASYKAKQRKPIHGTYRGHDVYGPPPPSSGGICLVLMLNTLENYDLKKNARYSAETLHLMTETMKRAYRDRALYLGDGDFVKIPAHLTTKEYAKKLAASIDPKKATPSADLAKDVKLSNSGSDTTHFSVIDADGMAVSNTYTLERSYGSRIVVKGAGFLLNNEMIDFNWFPGETTRNGQIGTEANTIRPGKRMLSSQTPTIVAKNGKVELVTGSPGSRTIINTVLNVVVNVIDFGMDARQAVDAPRTHHQWFPDELGFEGVGDHEKAVEKLRAMGHKVYSSSQGDAHTIVVHPKTGAYQGAEDRRINGKAAGF